MWVLFIIFSATSEYNYLKVNFRQVLTMNENIKLKSGVASPLRNDSDEIMVPSFSCGLSENEVVRSREKYGSNILTPKKRAGFLWQFLKNLKKIKV